MNRLDEPFVSIRPTKGPTPWRPYDRGQQCKVAPYSRHYRAFRKYYPGDNVVIVEDHDDHYTVEPMEADDKLKLSHWDLLPAQYLEATRVFLPAGLAKTGVILRILDNGQTKMVKDIHKGRVMFADGTEADSRQMAEILLPSEQKHLAETLVRYE